MKSWIGAMAVIAAVHVSGCGFDPLGADVWSAPAAYRVWWERTEACSERTGSFEAVEWLIVPGDGFDCPSGKCAGRWEPGRIYIAGAFVNDEMVVRHEMLHALLDRGGHPNPPFGVGCPLTWDTWTGAARARFGSAID
jgi:hypothetical protein